MKLLLCVVYLYAICLLALGVGVMAWLELEGEDV